MHTRMGVMMSESVESDVVVSEESTEVEAPAKEIDWKAEARKWESRAKESHAKATANEDAAARLAAIEEANKTEAEKTAERLAAAEQRAAELESKALRAEVAAAKGVPVALLSGSTQEELEASADALIEFRGEAPTPVPSSSALSRVNTTTAEPDFDAAIREAEEKRDFRTVISLKQQRAAAAAAK